MIEGPDPISRALDDRWLNAQLTDLVPLPANTGQIVMGVIGSHFTVATTAGRVIWQCDLGEIRSAG